MKVSAVLLGLVTIAACAPSLPAELMTRDDLMEEGEELPSDKLGWSGALYPGGPILEYSGVDLDDIDAQIQKDHPGLSLYGAPVPEDDDPEDDDDLGFSSAEEGPEGEAKGRLMARDEKLECFNAGLGVATKGIQMNDVWRNLRSAGGTCKVAKRKCVRVQCYKTAGAALCNKNNHTISLTCNHVSRMIERIAKTCIRPTCPIVISPRPGISCGTETGGQVWSSGRTWRVRAGSCPSASWNH